MTLGVTLSRCVCVRRIRLDGEGIAQNSGEGIVSLGVRHAVTLFVCPPN